MAAPAFVQGASGTNGGNSATCSATLSGVTAGNTILVFGEVDSATITLTSVKDGVPNTFTNIDSLAASSKTTITAYRQNVQSGSVTVTITWNTTSTAFKRMFIEEWSGLGVLDGHHAAATTATGSGQQMAAGSFTRLYQNDLIWIGAIATATPLTAGTGFTLVESNIASQAMYSESMTSAGPGTINPGITSGANGQIVWVMAAAFAGMPVGQPSLGERPWMRERPPDRGFFPQGSPALQAPPPVTQPPTPNDWPLPVRVQQPDRSLLTSILPILSPAPPVVPPPVPGLSELPIRVRQPDRSAFGALLPLVTPPPPPSPPPLQPLDGVPARVQQPARSLFSTAWAALIPCASFNSAYSDAYCGGVHPRWLQTWFVGLPPRGPELDRTAMIGLNLQLLFPAKPAPAPAPSPILSAAQPNRSFYQSAVPSTIPQNTPPPGAHFFALPVVAPQPNRSAFQGQIPSTISNVGLPIFHGQLPEVPRTADQFNRSMFHGHLPLPSTQQTPPPTHPLPGVPRVPPQFNRTVLFSSLLPDFNPGPIPFRTLPPVIHLILRTFDYTAFGRYPILVPAPHPPHPPHPHPWNPPKLPTDQWTVVGSGGQTWTKVTSGTQSWQSKPIPNS